MEKVIFTKEAIDYLDELVFKLFSNDYFAYQENAQRYVNKIFAFVERNIFSFPHKKSPIQLGHLGEYYIFYTPNRRTTWYIFFEKQNHYTIVSILNNHCPEAKFLGSG